MKPNSRAAAVCSGVCEIILNAYFGALAFVHVFSFFFFFGNEVSLIDYRLLGCFIPTFGVVFARVCMCFRIYASTNERVCWGLRSKEHLVEHLRRGHTDRRGDCPFAVLLTVFPILRTQSLTRPLLLSSRTLLDGHFSSNFFLLQLLQCSPLEHST